MSTLRLHVIASIAIAWMMGCGGSERPPPAGDSEGDTDEARLAEEVSLATQVSPSCVPFATRSCRIYYIDEDGQQHCPEALETCHADGKGFGKCGDVSGPNDSGAD